MNPIVVVQHPDGLTTSFELDERCIAADFGAATLLHLVMELYRSDAFTLLTALTLLPLGNDLAHAWQEERGIPWNVKARPPTVEWRFQERLAQTLRSNVFPLMVVHGNVDKTVFLRVVVDFFQTPNAIAGVYTC